MKYLTNPRETKKYIKGFSFLSFARMFGDKDDNVGMDAAKTESKRVVKKNGRGLIRFNTQFY